MANQVYANMMEVSCKAAAGKSVCAMPDVCFTPPQTPATPTGVPIPYPNTGMASDCTEGSRTVSISGQEVMLKNKSYFQKSTGDEAGCAPKKGIVTSKITGKVYFNSWSMDVIVEGENVVRHLDLTTHNHASFPGNSPTWPYLDEAAFSGSGPCKDVATKVQEGCIGSEESPKNLVAFTKAGKVKRAQSISAMCEEGSCKEAMSCVLTAKSPSNCCPNEAGETPTPHHIVPASQFKMPGKGGASIPLTSGGTYSYSKAPCLCVDGNSHSVGLHGEIHKATNKLTRAANGVDFGKTIPSDKRWSVGTAESTGAQAVEQETGCPKACTESQLRTGHDAMGIKATDQVRPTTAGGEEPPEVDTEF